jgi:hypothetical protein
MVEGPRSEPLHLKNHRFASDNITRKFTHDRERLIIGNQMSPRLRTQHFV